MNFMTASELTFSHHVRVAGSRVAGLLAGLRTLAAWLWPLRPLFAELAHELRTLPSGLRALPDGRRTLRAPFAELAVELFERQFVVAWETTVESKSAAGRQATVGLERHMISTVSKIPSSRGNRDKIRVLKKRMIRIRLTTHFYLTSWRLLHNLSRQWNGYNKYNDKEWLLN